ncbi:MAG TPA: cytochrome P450 [Jatrophihabitans sp.]|nr:cytochrome P450 [Jatrophihabitans sp.]
MTDPQTPPAVRYPAPRAGCPLAPPPAYLEAQGRPGLPRIELWDGTRPWLVTRYDDVRAVLADRRFSADSARPGFPFVSAAARTVGTQNRTFIRMDDPQHQRLRRMLTGDFRVRRMVELQPRIELLVTRLLDEFVAAGPPADLVAGFALPVPSLVICLLLGVPYADHAFFQERSRLMLDRSSDPAAVAAANQELHDYLVALAGRKVADPDDGVLAELVHRHELTGELSRAEVAQMARLLLVAGHETTAHQLALSVLALLRHPGQLAGLRADPDRIPAAVEELLRYLSVVHGGVGRLATEDVELAGTTVRAGEGVLCLLNAANRDPRTFGAGLRVDRDARHHVAFGYGVHQCLGQPLARVELAVALRALLRRLPGLALAEPAAPLPFRDEMVVYGVHRLPVIW